MPELPEVEVVRRGLAEHVVGRTIARADIKAGRVARRHGAGAADLAARLVDAEVLLADRRGKYLWLVVKQPDDDPHALIVHLGMSGQMLVEDAEAEMRRHQHATFDFVDASSQLRFTDQRTFGGLALVELVPALGHPHGIPLTITHIAPDPFEQAYDEDRAVARIASRTAGLKRLLLDQGLVSGIGNIYADEGLWRAGIHGGRSAAALTKPAIRRVLAACREVMAEALSAGGTSFDALYVNVNGQSGYFDRRLAVYGQQGLPCPRCGAAVVREHFMNRSSHYCPRCQRRPRYPR